MRAVSGLEFRLTGLSRLIFCSTTALKNCGPFDVDPSKATINYKEDEIVVFYDDDLQNAAPAKLF